MSWKTGRCHLNLYYSGGRTRALIMYQEWSITDRTFRVSTVPMSIVYTIGQSLTNRVSRALCSVLFPTHTHTMTEYPVHCALYYPPPPHWPSIPCTRACTVSLTGLSPCPVCPCSQRSSGIWGRRWSTRRTGGFQSHSLRRNEGPAGRAGLPRYVSTNN